MPTDLKIDWKAPLTDSNQIATKSLEFYFNQAEKRLKSSIEISDKITTRSYAFLAIVAPLTFLLLGIIGKSFLDIEPLADFNYQVLVMLLCILVACLFLITTLIFPWEFPVVGSSPRKKMKAQVFADPQNPGEDSYKWALIFEIEHLQARIDFAEKQNQKRMARLKRVLYLLLITISFLLLAILIG